MKDAALNVPPEVTPERGAVRRPWLRPAAVAAGVLALVATVLIADAGPHQFGQTTINGLVTGSYFALGALGLTFVYGILKLVNFAHGDFLAFGAYLAFACNVGLGLPLLFAALIGVALTGALAVASEYVVWRPMRARQAGTLQIILMSIGLAFVLRNAIQMVAGSQPRALDVDVSSSLSFPGGLRIGRSELVAAAIAYVVLLLAALMLRYTQLGKRMRALSDNLDLAETTGIDTNRVIAFTWIFAGVLAGLAGVLYAIGAGSFDPSFGFFLLLSLFASVILGGIGNANGALVGGLVLGLSQEWSTIVLDSRWKVAVGFAILIVALIVRPEGILGKARTL